MAEKKTKQIRSYFFSLTNGATLTVQLEPDDKQPVIDGIRLIFENSVGRKTPRYTTVNTNHIAYSEEYIYEMPIKETAKVAFQPALKLAQP